MSAAPPASRWFARLGLLALFAYGVFLDRHLTVVAGGSDSSGYLNAARLLAAGELRTPLRLTPEFGPAAALVRPHFTPLGFLDTRDPALLAPTYPTGLPLHLALAARLGGWTAGPRGLLLAAALAAVWLTYGLARDLGLPRLLAATAATLLAAFPVFLFTSFQPLSDTLATTWVLAAFRGALGARSRGSGRAALAGAALSLAVLVRPTNVVFAPALLLLLGPDIRRLAVFVAAGLPAAAWFLAYNRYQYGGMLASGYGDVGAAFGFRHFSPTARNFTLWLATLLPAAVLALPFAALAHPATRTRAALALGVGFTALTGTYLCYEVSHEVWWCLRFILPAVPLLLLLAIVGIEALARGPGSRWPRAFRPAFAAGLVLWAVALSAYHGPKLHLYYLRHYEKVYADGSAAAQRLLPPDALVASFAFSGALYFYTDFPIIRHDMMPPAEFSRYAAIARAAGRPLCAVVYDFEAEQLRSRSPGPWRTLGTVANVRFLQLE
jgi:hypothetical protein